MIESIPLAEIKSKIENRGWAFFKNKQTVEISEGARKEYFDHFQKFPLRAHGFSYEELQINPIRKQNISSKNGVGEPYAQVLQSTYFPSSAGFPWLERVFETLVILRNRLISKEDGYGTNPIRDHFWNANRIHHYPCGGGFMAKHCDTYFSKIQDLEQKDYLQVAFLLSRKGEDFQSGGGFLYDLNAAFVDVEEVGGLGAVFIYDGRIPHGVNDVDEGKIFSFENRTGRLAAFANLYKYLK